MPAGSSLSVRPPRRYQPHRRCCTMPVSQQDLSAAACLLFLAAMAFAAIYHWSPAAPANQDTAEDIEAAPQDDPVPSQAAAYHTSYPELRTRPLVPAIDLSIYTYM